MAAVPVGTRVKWRAKTRTVAGGKPYHRGTYVGTRGDKVVLRWWTLGHDREILVDPEQVVEVVAPTPTPAL